MTFVMVEMVVVVVRHLHLDGGEGGDVVAVPRQKTVLFVVLVLRQGHQPEEEKSEWPVMMNNNSRHHLPEMLVIVEQQ